MENVINTHLGQKLLEGDPRRGFGQNVSKLTMSSKLNLMDDAKFNFLSNKM
jgi:SRSO17 transposase